MPNIFSMDKRGGDYFTKKVLWDVWPNKQTVNEINNKITTNGLLQAINDIPGVNTSEVEIINLIRGIKQSCYQLSEILQLSLPVRIVVNDMKETASLTQRQNEHVLTISKLFIKKLLLETEDHESDSLRSKIRYWFVIAHEFYHARQIEHAPKYWGDTVESNMIAQKKHKALNLLSKLGQLLSPNKKWVGSLINSRRAAIELEARQNLGESSASAFALRFVKESARRSLSPKQQAAFRGIEYMLEQELKSLLNDKLLSSGKSHLIT